MGGGGGKGSLANPLAEGGVWSPSCGWGGPGTPLWMRRGVWGPPSPAICGFYPSYRTLSTVTAAAGGGDAGTCCETSVVSPEAAGRGRGIY